MRNLPFKILFFVLASPVVWRAAWRLHQRREERFDVLAEEMRRVDRPINGFLRRPGYLAAAAERWLPMVKPRGYGHCFGHCLLLLDLWSRCGLEPLLHLGTLDVETMGEREFHAWITTEAEGPRTSDGGHREIWRG